MSKLLSLSIDVTKIDKSRLYKGEKGTYLKLTIGINDEPDKYGNNVSCWEEQTKEERTAKAQRNFLGNGKVLFSGDNKPQGPQPQTAESMGFGDGDLPF